MKSFFRNALLILATVWSQQLLAGDLVNSADLVKSVSFSQLDLSNSIPIVFGKGDTKIAVFADPLDKHARRLEEEIEKLGNATLYVFINPILGDKSTQLANTIWCSPNRKGSWADRFSIETESAGRSCTESDAITKNISFAKRFPAQASPILVFENDLVHIGFATNEFIRETSTIKPAKSDDRIGEISQCDITLDNGEHISLRYAYGKRKLKPFNVGSGFNWYEVMRLAKEIDALGFRDWRLPTKTEVELMIKSKCDVRRNTWTSSVRNGRTAYLVEYYVKPWPSLERTDNPASFAYELTYSDGNEMFVRGGDSLEFRESYKIIDAIDNLARNKAREEEELRQRYDEKTIAFRKKIQPGDDTTVGIVIEVKGPLIKVQTNDTQCSQRDYNGDCKNWINTPVEKWIKRSEIFPPR